VAVASHSASLVSTNARRRYVPPQG